MTYYPIAPHTRTKPTSLRRGQYSAMEQGLWEKLEEWKGAVLITAFKKKCNAESRAFEMHFPDQLFEKYLPPPCETQMQY